jgi:hypothetical protein
MGDCEPSPTPIKKAPAQAGLPNEPKSKIHNRLSINENRKMRAILPSQNEPK